MSLRHSVRLGCLRFAPRIVIQTALHSHYSTMSSELDPRTSRVISSSPLLNNDAKWIGLRKIQWTDPTGKQRVWESADRTTRNGIADGTLS